MSAQHPGRQYSPDGRFWWDGTGWRPVDGPTPASAPPPPTAGPVAQPTTPVAPYGPPAGGPVPPPGPAPQGPGGPPPFHQPGGPQPAPQYAPGSPPGVGGQPGGPLPPSGVGRPGFPPPPHPAPRSRSKAGFVLALVGTVVVTGLLGGCIGWATGLATTEPPGIDTPPPLPAEFPAAEMQYLRGVTVALIADDWLKKANGWNCEKPEPGVNRFNPTKFMMDCRPRGDAELDMRVSIEYDADDKVKLVNAKCNLGVNNETCTSLFASMAHTVLTPQGEELQQQAEKWATENASTERSTVIGGVRLEANLDPNGMEATPAA